MVEARESKHVAVLIGGWSAEREVSLISGAACAATLEDTGYRVARIDVRRDPPALITAPTPRPDIAPEQAEHVGIGFAELCAWLVEGAACHG